MTVGHVVRMPSGVADFDAPTFDNFLLQANETYSVYSPIEFIQSASTQPAICDPGACMSLVTPRRTSLLQGSSSSLTPVPRSGLTWTSCPDCQRVRSPSLRTAVFSRYDMYTDGGYLPPPYGKQPGVLLRPCSLWMMKSGFAECRFL